MSLQLPGRPKANGADPHGATKAVILVRLTSYSSESQLVVLRCSIIVRHPAYQDLD